MKNKIYPILLLCLFALIACDDFLTKEPLAVPRLDDYYDGDTAIVSAVYAVYVPAQWQLASTYCNDWFIGDVVSDDALKGGASLSDMQPIYYMENFQTAANNEYLAPVYDINYQGIARSNFAIQEIMDMEHWTNPNLKSQLLAEARFLRAFYYFKLARIFGGVPKVDKVLTQKDISYPRASKEEIMAFIKEDLNEAIKNLPSKSQYPVSELGRATKGAAQALLMRVLLFDIENSTDKNKDYQEVMNLGNAIINSGEYRLMDKYGQIFETYTADPTSTARFNLENGPESIYEIQYMEEATSDYGGPGLTRGNFDIIMTRTRNGSKGWGFNRPSQDLYDAYESNDPRRDETILPYDAGDLYGTKSETDKGYNNGYHARKYSLAVKRVNATTGTVSFVYPALAHATRGSANNVVIRYADVLLMYAEAACKSGNINEGTSKLNMVRNRARNSSTDPSNMTILPPFPYGNYQNNASDLFKAIQHERRVEFGMEGLRWYDLIRWGVAGDVMNAYRQKYSNKEGQDMSEFKNGIHELFPIPETQLNANPALTQNPGY